MLLWITQNLGSVLICAGLMGICAAIVRYLIRQKKQGKGTCGGGCAHCANAGCCHHE